MTQTNESYSWFQSWTFRTSTPNLEPDDVVEVLTMTYEESSQLLLARIGDTRIYIEDGSPDMVNRSVKVRIIEFDSKKHEGKAELIRVGKKAGF